MNLCLFIITHVNHMGTSKYNGEKYTYVQGNEYGLGT